MANLKSKATTITISVFLMFAMAISLVALPNANAQTATKTYAFIGATPNPVGVGQQVLLHVGISQQTFTTYQSWTGLSVTITDPDGHETTIDDLTTDATGGTGTNFTPDTVGTYELQSHFPAQSLDIYTFWGTIAGSQDFAASDSDVLELVVQE